MVEVVEPDTRKGRLAAYDPALDARRATAGARVLSTLGYGAALAGPLVICVLLEGGSWGAGGGALGRIGRSGLGFAERILFVLGYAVLWLGPAGRLPGARG